MNFEKTNTTVETNFETEVIPGLSEFIKIDNLSPFFDTEWNSNGKLTLAAEFCLNWALKQGINGIKGEIIKDDDKTPLIYIEIAPNKCDKTIMLYGHFDKQPHFTGWAEGLGPCLPVIRDGFLYGRGGADDGYSIFSSILAIKTIQEQGQNHGRIILIIEGSEESGSPHLIPYLTALKDRIGTPDLMVCLDSGAQDYETLWITTNLRGNLVVDLTAQVLTEACHSGVGTGLAADSFMVLRNLLDRVEDSKTGKVNKMFHVDIPKSRIEEARKVAETKKGELRGVKLAEGVQTLSQDHTELILQNTWMPALCVTGAGDFPDYKTAGNVLRASSTLRLSLRLPPTKNGNEAFEQLNKLLTENPPFNAKITVGGRKPGSGWNSNEFSERLEKSLNNSSLKLFGREYLKFGEGGSIPFIKSLGDAYPKCEIVVMGVLGPNSNAHTCNEGLHIDYCKKITTTLAHTIADYCA